MVHFPQLFVCLLEGICINKAPRQWLNEKDMIYPVGIFQANNQMIEN
jgi:hypothetical protein